MGSFTAARDPDTIIVLYFGPRETPTLVQTFCEPNPAWYIHSVSPGSGGQSWQLDTTGAWSWVDHRKSTLAKGPAAHYVTANGVRNGLGPGRIITNLQSMLLDTIIFWVLAEPRTMNNLTIFVINSTCKI